MVERLSKTQYQYTLADADPGELDRWAALFLDKLKSVPGIADVASDQQNAGPLLDRRTTCSPVGSIRTVRSSSPSNVSPVLT
jgi:hypothetical protein